MFIITVENLFYMSIEKGKKVLISSKIIYFIGLDHIYGKLCQSIKKWKRPKNIYPETTQRFKCKIIFFYKIILLFSL